MKEQKKKRIIATLLFISCFISGYMLLATSGGEVNTLRNLSQVDSLIHQKFEDFNIGEQQVKVFTTPVDSNLSRKTYHVGLPYQFSKTQFHAELNKAFYDYNIKTPAEVTFPEQNVNIHLLYQGTVIRSVSLQTDPELTVNRNHVSILVAFEQPPDEELITQLQRMGEPVPMVFKIENPMQANDLTKRLSGQYEHIFFWLQNSNGNDILASNPGSAISKFQQLESILPDVKILQLQTDQQVQQQLAAETNLTIINAANALIIDEDPGKAAFFENFYKLQTNPAYSMAIISGNKTTLQWFQEKLPELKKAGTRLVLPSRMKF